MEFAQIWPVAQSLVVRHEIFEVPRAQRISPHINSARIPQINKMSTSHKNLDIHGDVTLCTEFDLTAELDCDVRLAALTIESSIFF